MAQDPKSGWRFTLGGVSLTSSPDALSPDKQASALNVRGYDPLSIRTRPGYTKLFGTSNNNSGASITDVMSYSAIQTDNDPRYLARDANGNVWLDSGNTTGNNAVGTNVGNMAAPQGFGASMLPWRPSASPQTWAYIATQGDYQKFSAPGNNNAVTQYKVGIAEGQVQLEAAPVAPSFTNFTGNNSNWTASGTATLTGNGNLISDTVQNVPLADPVISSRLSVPVSIPYYLTGSLVLVNSANTLCVQDVLPPIPQTTITAIRYASGNNGACQIVTGSLPIGEGPTTPTILGSLRRGAIVNFATGNENALVLSATPGPNGSAMFECSTTGAHAAGETISGVQAIILDGSVSNGQAITQPAVDSTITAGTGILSQTLSTNPFATQLGSSGNFPSEDDYIRLTVLAQNAAALTQLQIIFVCDTYSTFTYTQNSLLNLAAGDLAQIEFPISALVPSGSNASLRGCTSVQVSVTTSAAQAFDVAALCVIGGGNPDIGSDGAPYQYQLIGRSTVTGAQGNPSPVMRYGVSPRRQNVTIPLPAVSAELPAADSQVDIWDVYRYGGSVTSSRYIGSGAPSTTFADKFFDSTARAGQELPSQNFEPWPSVDVPWKVTSGGGITITVTGAQIVVSGATFPATILRWLPGTIVLLGGQSAYTLRKRPQSLSATSYLLDIVECAGSSSPSVLSIAEPFVAHQILPYVWGPDQYGYFYACGDPLRPGTVSFCAPNNPDVTASTNTNEPSTPSEPLLMGNVIAGFSYVPSSDGWWAMIPAFSGTKVFAPYKIPCERGSAAPYGTCTDKTRIFFWAKDGIGFHAGGGYTSLTDADLYPLFPHDDIQVVPDIVRNGVTFYAPDYSRAATFRLSWVNGYLYADYQDSTGTPRTLVCNLKTGAWVQDSYANSITCRVSIVQPEGTLITSPGEDYGLGVIADNHGNVYAPSLTAGDNGANIDGLWAGFEWDGEPNRQSGLWNDFYLDVVPPYGLTVNAVMFGVVQTQIPTVTVGATSDRILARAPVIPDGSLNRFLGLQISWSDQPGSQVTLLHTWRSFADPDSVFAWSTQRTTFGLHGYTFVGRIELAYSSTATVTLNLTAFDGTSSATMTVPSTGGVIQKILVTPTFNKAQMFVFSATSAAPMQIFGKAALIWVRQWGSSGPWLLFPLAADGAVKP